MGTPAAHQPHKTYKVNISSLTLGKNKIVRKGQLVKGIHFKDAHLKTAMTNNWVTEITPST